LEKHLQLCLNFRKETHLVSYGSLAAFSAEETEKYFHYISSKKGYIFQHVLIGSNIIGQLEFNPWAGIRNEDKFAYINLFYLKKEYRGVGYGKVLHDHVVEKIIQAGCNVAELRVIPGNVIAEKFYTKNGWLAVSVPTERGQLMQLNL